MYSNIGNNIVNSQWLAQPGYENSQTFTRPQPELTPHNPRENSTEAYTSYIASGRQLTDAEIIAQVVAQHPGHTFKEIARILEWQDPTRVSRRLADMERQGMIHRAGKFEGRACCYPGRKS